MMPIGGRSLRSVAEWNGTEREFYHSLSIFVPFRGFKSGRTQKQAQKSLKIQNRAAAARFRIFGDTISLLKTTKKVKNL